MRTLTIYFCLLGFVPLEFKLENLNHRVGVCSIHTNLPLSLSLIGGSFQLTSLFSKTNYARWNEYFVKAEKEFQNNKYEKSLYYLRKTYKTFKQWQPKQKEGHLKQYVYAKILKLLGDCHLRLGREYEAVEYYEKSLAYNLKQKVILSFLGEFYLDINDFTTSCLFFKSVLSNNNQ